MNITAFINTVFRESGILRKFMLVMKITTFLLLVVLMQVSATGLAQKINLNEKNMSLKKVIEKVRLQSGYNFLYIEDILAQAKPVNINIKNADFETALKQIFVNQPFDYEITTEKTVVIKEKTPSFLDRILETITVDDVRGRVLDEKGEPLPGASVKIKGTSVSYLTNTIGEFVITNVSSDVTLQISFVGYRTKEINVSEIKGFLTIALVLLPTKLEEVNIVSTGYQTLPKERATGSFEIIDNTLFNRKTGINVLDRLDGVTNSILINKLQFDRPVNDPLASITIRGLSSFSVFQPLVVVDNFPYEGDIRNINPNDVESVTILKDAAAASIWGTRSGNGVIVITTKKGAFDQPLKVAFNSNVTLTQKPDLFYLNKMSSSDYIDVEQFLFNKGYYDGRFYFEPSVELYSSKSPVLELLNKQRNNTISQAEAEATINALKNVDSRNDFLKYIYRQGVNQQYAINVNGGGKQTSYLLSAGYDKNLNNVVTSDFERISLRSHNTFRPIANLEISAGILYTNTRNKNTGTESDVEYSLMGFGVRNYPYLQLADQNGNPLAIDVVPYSKTFRESAGDGLLLNWQYKPLAELNSSSNINAKQDLLLNLGVTYKINPIFNASVKYQFEKTNGEISNLQGLGSFYTRSYINYFTEYNSTGITAHNVPIGDILYENTNSVNSKALRGEINANKIWHEIHELNVIAGAEMRDNNSLSHYNPKSYGYNQDRLSYTPVDYVTNFPFINGLDGNSRIADGTLLSDRTDRYTSLFGNAAYTYSKRYTISMSARKDAANIFGVNANRRGQPLWSVGLAWNLANEAFYKSEFLPYLKLRATYGYQGNANNTVSANPIISFVTLPNPSTQLPYASVQTPPNPSLRAEKVGIFNLGLDFKFKNNRLSGFLEYFEKRSKDLIAYTVADPTTGFSSFNINSGNIYGKGVDLLINSINLKGKDWSWVTNTRFSYNRNIVKDYKGEDLPPISYVNPGGGSQVAIRPLEGKDLYPVFTYKWAGLDPLTGAPVGYLNGIPSKNYGRLILPEKMDDLDYHGSAVPIYYGSMLNTFNWKAFALSVNLQYKFDYVFQRSGIRYNVLYQDGNGLYGEYSQRWRQPGDEKFTSVPSQVYPGDSNRDRFYAGSSSVVESGNHIRLQDINMSYTFNKIASIKNLRLYANMSNIGIIWRANKHGIDPDYGLNYPAPRTFAFGLNANF